ncbi:hypothetical protein J3F84DRAFT_372514 [Trichoderma pleuroticola]
MRLPSLSSLLWLFNLSASLWGYVLPLGIDPRKCVDETRVRLHVFLYPLPLHRVNVSPESEPHRIAVAALLRRRYTGHPIPAVPKCQPLSLVMIL